MNYFRSLEGRTTSKSCPFAESTLKMVTKFPKNCPYYRVFVQSEGSGVVPQVLNHSILIVWIQLRVVGLRMLSAGLHLAVLRPSLSVTRPHIAISEHLLTARNR